MMVHTAKLDDNALKLDTLMNSYTNQMASHSTIKCKTLAGSTSERTTIIASLQTIHKTRPAPKSLGMSSIKFQHSFLLNISPSIIT